MPDIPTPWSLIGQAFREADDQALADLQEHGYPQETKQEDGQ